MTKSRKASHVVTAGTALAISMAFASCGEQSTGAGDPAVVKNVASKIAIAKGVSPNVAVAIDNTTVENSRVLAEEMKAKAQQAVDPILVTGGHVQISLFAQAGVAPVNLIDEQVPTSAELSGVRRDNFLITARENTSALLDQALGLAPVPAKSALASQLEAMPANGSDVAGMVRTLVADLKREGGGALVALGDGLQRSQGVNFSTDLLKLSTTKAADAIAALMPPDASGVSIAMYGVGNAGRATTTTERSIRAAAAWTLACQRTKAAACLVSPTI